MTVRRVAMVLAFALVVSSAGSSLSAQEQEYTIPARLLEGGKVFFVSDLQAWSDSMLVFRQFRRDFRRLDRFEEVDDREEADLICILSGDPNVVGQQGIVNRGIPYPSGYATSKVMLLVIFEAGNDNLLYMDALDWDTAATMTASASHTRLVQRLKAALDDAG